MRINSVESTSFTATFGPNQNSRVFFGTSTPSGTISDNDLWFEGGPKYPIPWCYNSTAGRWYSQPMPYYFGFTGTGTGQYLPTPLEFFNNSAITGHIVESITGLIYTYGTNDLGNFWRIDFYQFDGVNGWTFLNRFNTDTITQDGANIVQAPNSTRRINETPTNLFIPGNRWAICVYLSKVGNPTNIYLSLIARISATRA